MRRVRHNKRGSTYEVLGEAEVQLSNPSSFLKGSGQGFRRVMEGSKLMIYRSEKDGKLWARFPDEFEDGRFEDLETEK